jgi:hypothetical protein
MNRRIRNRTYVGVGGRREQSRLLPDQLNPPPVLKQNHPGIIGQTHAPVIS